MKKTSLLLGLLLFACAKKEGGLDSAEGNASPGKEPLYLKCSDSDPNLCGYLDAENNEVVPFGKYEYCYSDTFATFAIVRDAKKGLIGIDRSEKEIFKVYDFDNGPDYVSEGLFRITKDGKIGFADQNGNIVVEPTLDFAHPFTNGLACFAEGSEIVKEPGGEHSMVRGGKWGMIDRLGNKILPALYDKAFEFSNGRAEVVLAGKTVIIEREAAGKTEGE